MLIPDRYPKVLFDDNGVFSDISTSMLNFGADTESLVIVAAQDKLYFGREKPFRAVYVELGTANTNASVMTVKYYDEDAAAFTSVTDLVDETKGFTRSGFIQFQNPASDTSSVTWAETAVNSVTRYWIQITFSANFSVGTTIKGMNLVYSDDNDLKRVYDGVSSYFRTGTSTGILYHEQARKEIINALRKDGKFKIRINDNAEVAQLDEWDFHNIEEVNLWSTYLALSYIFDNISIATDDKNSVLSNKFYNKAQAMKQAYYLTLDKDDDGIVDTGERLGTQNASGTVIRR